jgi:RNA polymerase sigma factor (TIGR02999 family)
LFTHVYGELRRLAQARMALERPGHTLQATALVHEAYLKLIGGADLEWRSRAQFFAAAAEAMRRILIDHARSKGRVKRGGGRRRLSLDVLDLAIDGSFEDFLSVEESIRRLEKRDERMAEIVKLRFYAGLSEAEIATVLGVTDRTVRRDWVVARAWLQKELRGV